MKVLASGVQLVNKVDIEVKILIRKIFLDARRLATKKQRQLRGMEYSKCRIVPWNELSEVVRPNVLFFDRGIDEPPTGREEHVIAIPRSGTIKELVTGSMRKTRRGGRVKLVNASEDIGCDDAGIDTAAANKAVKSRQLGPARRVQTSYRTGECGPFVQLVRSMDELGDQGS